jgi:hypothetical protein
VDGGDIVSGECCESSGYRLGRFGLGRFDDPKDWAIASIHPWSVVKFACQG